MTTTIGSDSLGDGSTGVRRTRPADNGGSPITEYQLWMDCDDDDCGGCSQVFLGDGTFYQHGDCTEGITCRFYVLARNALGLSAQSHVLAIVMAVVPRAPITPEIVDIFPSRQLQGFGSDPYDSSLRLGMALDEVEGTSISVSWKAPPSNGGSQITGYRLYMFTGIAKNTVIDNYPVKKEMQTIKTSIDEPQFEQQSVEIKATSGTFRLRIAHEQTEPLDYLTSTAAEIDDALEALSNLRASGGNKVVVEVGRDPMEKG